MNISAKILGIQDTLRTIYASKEYQDELSAHKESIASQCIKRCERGKSSDVLVISKHIVEALRKECGVRELSSDKIMEVYVTSFGHLRITVVDVDEPVVIVG